MFCTCGADNERPAKYCRACGNPMSAAVAAAPALPFPEPGTMRGVRTAVPSRAPTGRNPAVAAALSVLLVGLGQFYNGDAKKGVTMLVGAIVVGVVSAGVLWPVVLIWSAVDAHKVASGTGRPW